MSSFDKIKSNFSSVVIFITLSKLRFIDIVNQSTAYGKLFEDYDKGRFPEGNYRYIYNRLSKSIFVTHPESMVAVYAYMNLKEVELNNITTIIEGIRYNLNPDFIRTHIGLE